MVLENNDQPMMGHLVVVDDGDAVVCHECGRPYRLLSSHARQTHGLQAGEYRERWGLNRTTSLAAPALLAQRAQEGLRRYATAAVREGLQMGQDMARSGQLLERSLAAQPKGSSRQQRRDRAAQTTAPARARTAEAAARRLEQRIADLGFASFPLYWAQRYEAEETPIRVIRRELGVGGNTLARLLRVHAVGERRKPGGAR